MRAAAREPVSLARCKPGNRGHPVKEASVRRSLLALPIVVVLLFAPAALAGGWATVGLSSTPAGTQPGKPWSVDLTVLQHGRTPLANVQPVVTIKNGDSTRRFMAKPTATTGVYHADVVFPVAGRWEYEIDDGFISQIPHTFPPVQIGAAVAAPSPAASTDEGGGPSALWLIPGVALLAAAVLLAAGDRRRRRQPQPA
jgi:hypothetical protein